MVNRDRYSSVITGVFCGTLVSTIILSGKIVEVAGVSFPASIVLFPLTFLIGDVLTEVYGYAVARRAVWAGLIAETLWIAGYLAAASLPPAPYWGGQEAFVATLGLTPRIAVAGMLAYVVGEFLNAYALARLKVATAGRALPLRMVASTVIGAGADTAIVLAVAFGGVYPSADLVKMGLAVWALKVAWEVAALPISLPVISRLKRAEGSDHFDRDTDFSPFKLGR
jgi:uncharacterized integral membrane protein (TIGR00697 family)